MTVKTFRPEDLEPIERASQDELRALQLQRLKWTLKHAYENVPHYRASFDAAQTLPSAPMAGAVTSGSGVSNVWATFPSGVISSSRLVRATARLPSSKLVA